MTERQFRLWDRDWKTVLLETTDYSAAEQFLRDSGFDWLPVTVDWGPDWKSRWSGRLELNDGAVTAHDESSYLKYMMTWPNVPVQAAGGGLVWSQPTQDCPCREAGRPRYYCWIAAPDCPHGLPERLLDGGPMSVVEETNR